MQQVARSPNHTLHAYNPYTLIARPEVIETFEIFKPRCAVCTVQGRTKQKTKRQKENNSRCIVPCEYVWITEHAEKLIFTRMCHRCESRDAVKPNDRIAALHFFFSFFSKFTSVCTFPSNTVERGSSPVSPWFVVEIPKEEEHRFSTFVECTDTNRAFVTRFASVHQASDRLRFTYNSRRWTHYNLPFRKAIKDPKSASIGKNCSRVSHECSISASKATEGNNIQVGIKRVFWFRIPRSKSFSESFLLPFFSSRERTGKTFCGHFFAHASLWTRYI